jgi:hypothetical protein
MFKQRMNGLLRVEGSYRKREEKGTKHLITCPLYHVLHMYFYK